MARTEDEVEIVLERLRIMPGSIKLHIGNYGAFTRDELIEQVSNKTEIGQLVVRMQMTYIRSFKERASV